LTNIYCLSDKHTVDPKETMKKLFDQTGEAILPEGLPENLGGWDWVDKDGWTVADAAASAGNCGRGSKIPRRL
jgi:endo-1,4-beta-D-glucanase Y